MDFIEAYCSILDFASISDADILNQNWALLKTFHDPTICGFSSNKFKFDVLLQVLNNFPANTEYLGLNNLDISQEEYINLLENLPANLKVLHITDLKLTLNDNLDFSKIFTALNPNITLNLSCNKVDEDFLRIIKSLPANIKKLDLSDLVFTNEDFLALERLFAIIPSSVQSLKLSDEFNPEQWIRVIRSLHAYLKFLTIFSIDLRAFSFFETVDICQALVNSCGKLEVSFNSTKDQGTALKTIFFQPHCLTSGSTSNRDLSMALQLNRTRLELQMIAIAEVIYKKGLDSVILLDILTWLPELCKNPTPEKLRFTNIAPDPHRDSYLSEMAMQAYYTLKSGNAIL